MGFTSDAIGRSYYYVDGGFFGEFVFALDLDGAVDAAGNGVAGVGIGCGAVRAGEGIEEGSC